MSVDMGSWGQEDVPPQPVSVGGLFEPDVSDNDQIDRAHAAVERAETRVRTEGRRLAAAHRAVEDAAGALVLARKRQTEHAAGRIPQDRDEDDAKTSALAEAVRRAERKLLLAEEAIADREAECETADVALARTRDALERKKTAVISQLVAGGDAEGEEDPPELVYANVAEFVEDWLLPLYRRRMTVWCAQWWKHTEANARLEALWLSWEQLRQDPALGLSVWLRDHLDHHMPILVANDGPLRGCKPDHHEDQRQTWPSLTPPPGLYTDGQEQNAP